MNDNFVLLRRTDPVEGEMLAGLLQRQGIPTRLVGKSPALLGAGPSIIETRLEVPESMLEQARELIEEVSYVGANATFDEPDQALPPEGERADAQAARTSAERRHPIMGAGIAFAIPGGCHLYARRPWTALLVALGLLLSLVLAIMADASRSVATAGLAGLIGMVACDIVAGLRAVRAFNGGVRVGRGGQVWRGLLLLVIGATVATAMGFVSLVPGWARAMRLASFAVSCSESSITVEHHGRGELEAAVDAVLVVESREEELRPVDMSRAPFALAPGRPHTVPISVEESTRRGCAERPRSCRFDFSLLVTRPGGRVDVQGVGSCRPPWGRAEVVQGELRDPEGRR